MPFIPKNSKTRAYPCAVLVKKTTIRVESQTLTVNIISGKRASLYQEQITLLS